MNAAQSLLAYDCSEPGRHRRAAIGGCNPACFAQPDPNWLDHDRNRPQPPLVTPATASTQEQAGKPPSDATVLFDGKDLSQWSSMDGSPTKWITRDGYMECVKGSGYIRTLQNFGDCQLHVEWAAPVPGQGEGQGRGNSGVFFGLDRYEIQVLDSFENKTYADGGAGAVYGQYPPLVNVSLPPGQWQTYDIVYTAPRFDAEGKLLSPVRLTVFQNGVLIQNNVQLTGPTSWLERAPYQRPPGEATHLPARPRQPGPLPQCLGPRAGQAGQERIHPAGRLARQLCRQVRRHRGLARGCATGGAVGRRQVPALCRVPDEVLREDDRRAD